MLLDPEDQGLTKDLVLYKTREPCSIQYLKEFIGISDIAIDIGANKGLYALLEAKLATEGNVYAIEPIPRNLDFLKANIEHNNLKNVEVFPLAISDSTGKGQMYTYDEHNFASFNLNEDARVTGSVDVSVMTLDGFIKAYVEGPPSFIRFDVEGHEVEIIKGATDLLSGKSPLKIFMEVHGVYVDQEELLSLLNVLEQNAFNVTAVFREPPLFNLHSLKILSKLEKKSGGDVKFGLVGASYNSVLKTVSEAGLCHVFLERK
jgi:FkbM family methyltransferase